MNTTAGQPMASPTFHVVPLFSTGTVQPVHVRDCTPEQRIEALEDTVIALGRRIAALEGR